MAGVNLHGVVKKFGDNEVVHGIDLDIANKEFIVLVGPSGCGKSTILRMIAGLEDVTRGEIRIEDRVVNELAPKDRNIAMVFQDYALYPHLSVYRNISFGLEMQKLPREDIRERVLEAAGILNIGELLDRKPKQLSGGQRQRVAMGRAIVRRPNVFLFDEPLSNLDAKLRTLMRTEIKKLHRTLATTIIYVTHDQVEAMTLADRIVVLKDGYIEQIGSPDDVYNHPASIFVAGFIGAPTMNFISGRLFKQNGDLTVHLNSGTVLSIPPEKAGRYEAHADREVVMGMRPENFSPVASKTNGESTNSLAVKVNVIEPLGATTLYFFQLAAEEVVACLPPISGVQPGDVLHLKVDMSKLHLFDPETEKVL